MKRPVWSGARSRSVPGRAKPLRPSERPAHRAVHRTRRAAANRRARPVRGSACGRAPRSGSRPGSAASERTMFPAGSTGRQPGSVRAGRERPPDDLPYQAIESFRAREPRQDTPLPIHEEQPPPGLAQPVAERDASRARRSPSGEMTRRPNQTSSMPWRRHVDPDRVRQRVRRPVVAQADPRLVLTLGQHRPASSRPSHSISTGPFEVLPAAFDRPNHPRPNRRRRRRRAGPSPSSLNVIEAVSGRSRRRARTRDCTLVPKIAAGWFLRPWVSANAAAVAASSATTSTVEAIRATAGSF